jgi:hypothetical protein
MANKAVIDWFDGLEAVLHSEAQLSGLLAHGSTIGQAREFVVTRLLKTILPSSVHIGSGKVIDGNGSYSKQVDIIIYDPRFPLMRVDGGGLYFVEGVLAAMEVKSTITSDELKVSLENCKSVLALTPHGEHPEEAEARIAFYMKKGALSHQMAEHRFWYMFRPATYVFAFSSQLSFDTTCRCIQSWWQALGYQHSAYFPLLPRVITSGDVVGVVNDGRIQLNAADGGTNHVMGLFKTNRRFRWLAIHLMDAVNQRLGLRNFAESFDYRISNYYPFDQYVSEIQGADTKFISLQTSVPHA